MRLDFIRTFLNSTTELLREVIDPATTASAIRIHPGLMTAGEMMTVITLTGAAEGQVIFDLDEQTAIQLAQQMLQEPVSELSPLARSAITELASMATGRALSQLNDAGTPMHMIPPVVISEQQFLHHEQTQETLVVPLHTVCGEVRINISVHDLK